MPSSESTAIPPLPPYPGHDRGRWLGLIAGASALALAAGFGIGRATGGDDGSGPKLTTVKVGTTEANSDIWPIMQRLGKAEGLNIEPVSFSDYTQANPALSQGQIDLNLFQHLQFLGSYNVEAKQNLTPIGATVITPLPLYSKKYQKLNQIPAGGKIAIPYDATNQARALLVLQAAKLLTLKDGGNALSTPADIDKAASKVTVVPVDAAQTVASLPSVDGAIINNNFALDADLDPNKALFQDDPKSRNAEPYINVVVSRAEDKDNATYAKVVKIWHNPEVLAAKKKETKNTAVIIDRPAADLSKILQRLEKDIAAK